MAAHSGETSRNQIIFIVYVLYQQLLFKYNTQCGINGELITKTDGVRTCVYCSVVHSIKQCLPSALILFALSNDTFVSSSLITAK